MMALRALLLVFLLKEINAFSYYTSATHVFTPPSGNVSYFGYSVLLRTGNNTEIIVGAPKEKRTDQKIDQPGAIYTCSINETSCTMFLFRDQKMSNNMLLGLSLDGSTKDDGIFVACAPKIIRKKDEVDYWNGICFSNGPNEAIEPLNDGNQHSGSPGKSNFLLLNHFGQAGISTKLSNDGTKLIIGAPGYKNWTGSTIEYGIAKNGSLQNKSVLQINMYLPTSQSRQYYGYSVGYINDAKYFITIAGAPRNSMATGSVLIVSTTKRTRRPKVNNKILIGTQIGEYFGSTIATIDINNDNLTDLLIGAPTYSQLNTWDLGRVHVYIQEDGSFNKSETIEGDRNGGRFGTSIADIGDINGDGFTDVAIGAPYEDEGRGAVYIYLGSAKGLNPKHVQRITNSATRGFGISISKGVDIDQNSCKDIAVGAFMSSSVILLRCHPSYTFETSIEELTPASNESDINIPIRINISFTGTNLATSKASLKITLVVDQDYNRISLQPNKPMNQKYVQIEEFDFIKKHFQSEKLYIKKDQLEQNLNPVEIKLMFEELLDPITETDEKERAVLQPNTKMEHIHYIDLTKLYYEHNSKDPPYIEVSSFSEKNITIGMSPSFCITITVKNHGHIAYSTNVTIKMPMKINVWNIPKNCHIGYTSLICEIGDLKQYELKNVSLRFESSMLTIGDSNSNLTFEITANSSKKNLISNSSYKKIDITILKKGNIELQRNKKQENRINVFQSSEYDSSRNVNHSLKIINKGPTYFENIDLTFYLPSEDLKSNTKILDKPVVKLNDELVPCSETADTKNNTNDLTDESPPSQKASSKKIVNCTSGKNILCKKYVCKNLKINPEVNQLLIETKIDTISVCPILNDNKHLILSLRVDVDSKFNESGIVSAFPQCQIYFTETKLDVSSAAIGLVAGLVGLIPIIWILYKMKFFERKVKTRLKTMKKKFAEEERRRTLSRANNAVSSTSE